MKLSFSDHHNPISVHVAFHIVTSHLFRKAKQMTGFYVKCKAGLKWFNMMKIRPK